MKTALIQYTIRDDVSSGEFEEWMMAVDIPVISNLGSVSDYSFHRATASMDPTEDVTGIYVEHIAINDLDQFMADAMSDEVKPIAEKFATFLAGPPKFIILDQAYPDTQAA